MAQPSMSAAIMHEFWQDAEKVYQQMEMAVVAPRARGTRTIGMCSFDARSSGLTRPLDRDVMNDRLLRIIT